MRVFALAVVLAVLSACSGPHTSNSAADVEAAAAQAQGDIDTYAANTLNGTPVARPAAAPSVAPSSLPTPAETVMKAPTKEDGARAAVDVVISYFKLIERKQFGDAWALWDDSGSASGMTRRRFADSFAKYAQYRAEVGSPGRVDAGAGQRYVDIPVRADGTLADGRPFALRGTLTLHRTADVDGTTQEQRSWRISGSSLKPRAAEAAAVTQSSYDCAGATRVSARDVGTRPARVGQGSRANGIWYRGDDVSAPVPCSAGE